MVSKKNATASESSSAIAITIITAVDDEVSSLAAGPNCLFH